MDNSKTTTARPARDDDAIRRQRSTLGYEFAIAFPAAIVLWFGAYYLLPSPVGMEEMLGRLVFALKCCCIALLLCFLTGIEAVAHERLRSPAIDPLSGYQTRRMTINLRYLQNTLEQFVLFAFGLLGLAVYSTPAWSMRAVAATTLVWILARIAFWIGYHYGAEHRAIGAPGVMLTMLVLLYVCARFGYEIAGVAGAAAPLVLFAIAEAVLVRATRPAHP